MTVCGQLIKQFHCYKVTCFVLSVILTMSHPRRQTFNMLWLAEAEQVN